MADNDRSFQSPAENVAPESQTVAAETIHTEAPVASEGAGSEPAPADSVEVQDPAALLASVTAERDRL
ncbi:MAG: hypothetical protein ACP5U2_14790, partial [Bryobacteraceae bacterium]